MNVNIKLCKKCMHVYGGEFVLALVSQQTFLSLLKGHNLYFRYQSIVSLVLLIGHNSYHAYWDVVDIVKNIFFPFPSNLSNDFWL